VTEYRSAGPKRRPPRLRVELTQVEVVVITGALQRDLRLPDVDHRTIRDVLAKLAGGG